MVIADANSVIVADAVTLEAHSVETGRFNPLQACALEEPNAVLIKGNVREQWQRDYYYVYELVTIPSRRSRTSASCRRAAARANARCD